MYVKKTETSSVKNFVLVLNFFRFSTSLTEVEGRRRSWVAELVSSSSHGLWSPGSPCSWWRYWSPASHCFQYIHFAVASGTGPAAIGSQTCLCGTCSAGVVFNGVHRSKSNSSTQHKFISGSIQKMGGKHQQLYSGELSKNKFSAGGVRGSSQTSKVPETASPWFH